MSWAFWWFFGGGGGTSSGAVGATYSTNVQQFFDRLATPPVPKRAELYAQFINTLDTAGVWVKLDFLNLYAASDAGTGLTNLVSASYQGVYAGVSSTPIFAIDQGITGDGAVNNLVGTQYNPSLASGSFTQNSACVFGWQLGSTAVMGAIIADTDIHGDTELWPRYTGDIIYANINTGGTEASGSNTDGSGFYLANRTASNLTTTYRNNATILTATTVSAAIRDVTISTCMTTQTIAMAGAGASLSEAQVTALYNAAQTYLHGIGAV